MGKGGRKRGRETAIFLWLPLMRPLLGTWPKNQACALTGKRTGDPLVCRLTLNPLSHTQGYLFIFRERRREGKREGEKH